MGLFDFWKQPCAQCGEMFSRGALAAVGDSMWCEGCREEAAAAAKAVQVEARRQAEEEARARLESGKQFGVDPRTSR